MTHQWPCVTSDPDFKVTTKKCCDLEIRVRGHARSLKGHWSVTWDRVTQHHTHTMMEHARPPSWILKFSQYLSKSQIWAYFYVHMQFCWTLDDPRPSYCVFSIFKMAGVRHLGFGRRRHIGPPTTCVWLSYILLKLHVDCVYILHDIAIFIFGRFGLNSDIVATPKRNVLRRKNPSTGLTWARARENKKLSWCRQTRATRLEVSQGHQT